MKRFQNILCLVDASAKHQVALRRASELAVRNGAQLRIVDVIDDMPTWFGMTLKPHAAAFEDGRRAHLRSLAESLPAGIEKVTSELLHGRPALAVVREVLRHRFDLVVKDARGTSHHKTLLVGSIDMRLLRNCPCPVWLNVPDRDNKTRVILAAIDPLAEGQNTEV